MTAACDDPVDARSDLAERGDAQARRFDRVGVTDGGRSRRAPPPQHRSESLDASLDGLLRWFYGGSEPAEPLPTEPTACKRPAAAARPRR